MPDKPGPMAFAMAEEEIANALRLPRMGILRAEFVRSTVLQGYAKTPARPLMVMTKKMAVCRCLDVGRRTVNGVRT